MMHYLNYFSNTAYNKTPDYFFDASHLTLLGAAVFPSSLTDALDVRNYDRKK